MPMKVLCLHAFRTSGDILKTQMEQLGTFASAFGGDVTFEYLNGTHRCTPADEAKMEPLVKQFFPGPYYEWINASRVGDKMIYSHVDETMKRLVDHVRSNGPYDGILGFSQGGSIAHMYCLLAAKGEPGFVMPKMLIVVSSRPSRHDSHDPIVNAARMSKLQVPALVFYCAKDDHVRADETRAVVDTLGNCTQIFDPAGTSHKIPNLPPAHKAKVAEFLAAVKSGQRAPASIGVVATAAGGGMAGGSAGAGAGAGGGSSPAIGSPPARPVGGGASTVSSTLCVVWISAFFALFDVTSTPGAGTFSWACIAGGFGPVRFGASLI